MLKGSDTSSTALAAAFFYLSRYPACYDKLVSEIRSIFPSGQEIQTGPKLSQCYYLRACIDEAMRMTPPVGGPLWREVCVGGLVIDSELIPAGYDVSCSTYVIHHSEEIFPNSYTYKPERWIVSGDNPKEVVDRARAAFSPFSLGSRACAGRTMAYMEISDTLAKTIWYLDFRRPVSGHLGRVGEGTEGKGDGRGRVNEFQLMDHLTSSHDGPFLEFRCRADSGEGFGKELFVDDHGDGKEVVE